MIRRLDDDGAAAAPDHLVVEEPLEIRLDDHLATTTMRTPGHDFELAGGWCFTEGLLAGAPVRAIRYCATGPATETGFNVVTVETGGLAPIPPTRLTTTTSSCGICGSTTVDDLRSRLVPLTRDVRFSHEVLVEVPDRVRAQQVLFDSTGGVHAAAAFDADGIPVVVREDVGRHNAVDKVVGRLLLDGALPASGMGLFVSGRTSFEIVQKAWAAGFATVLSVSAPSSLAVETAAAGGVELFGFVRGRRVNAYGILV